MILAMSTRMCIVETLMVALSTINSQELFIKSCPQHTAVRLSSHLFQLALLTVLLKSQFTSKMKPIRDALKIFETLKSLMIGIRSRNLLGKSDTLHFCHRKSPTFCGNAVRENSSDHWGDVGHGRGHRQQVRCMGCSKNDPPRKRQTAFEANCR